MVADWSKATAVVAIGNVALVAPSGTVTVAGTDASCGLLLDRMTAVPPAGAGVLTVTVPVDAPPPGTVAGVSANDWIDMNAGAGWGAGVGVGSGAGAAGSATVTEKSRV